MPRATVDATMATATEPQQLSSAIISFALDGNFPEDAAALLAVSETDLGPTIAALDKAKVDIEVLRLPSTLSCRSGNASYFNTTSI